MATLYDIYVTKNNGIPLFTGCTGTNYCMTHLGQHELVSGFFAAMRSFAKESFKDEDLQTMIFSEIRINFLEDDNNELLLAFVHDITANDNRIRNDLKKARDLFVKKYGDHLDDNLVDQQIFEDFREELRDAGIIEGNLGNVIEMVKFNEKKEEEQKISRPNLISWLRSKFRRNK